MVGSWCSRALILTYSTDELGLSDPQGRCGERRHACHVGTLAFTFLHHVNFFLVRNYIRLKICSCSTKNSYTI